MGLISSLYTGVSGLQVSQRGLNVTAHNLSNIETKGYVRQVSRQMDAPYIKVGTTANSAMQVGSGATAASIHQVRNIFLDKAYRQELGRQHFYEIQYECTSEMEEILGELEGVAFQDSVEELWESMQELCKEPDSIVARTSFIQTSVSFIERAQNIYTQIKEYQLNLNGNIQNIVDRVNEIAEEIHYLNGQIQKNEASGLELGADYRDQRNSLLDELSSIGTISYQEHANGVITVMFENQTLISEDLTYRMETRPLDNETGMIEPYWPAYADSPVYRFKPLPSTEFNTDIGTLKGLLLIRGQIIGKHTDIPVEPSKEDFTDDSGNFYAADYDDACREYKKALEVFNMEVESSAIVSVEAQFDRLINGIVTAINDVLCPNKEVITSEGEKILIFDEENAPVGMDENFTPGEALFNRKSIDRYEKTTIIMEVDGIFQEVEVWKYNEEDPSNNYSLFTIGEIEVNSNIMKDPSLLPISSNEKTGEYAVEICKELMDAWQKDFATLNPNEYKPLNFKEYYAEIITALANKGEKFRSLYQSQETLVKDIDNQRLSITAVSSDEELTNMIRFQQAYNASARYVNVVSQMLEHLLNALG